MSRAVPPCSGGRRADDSLRGAGGPRSGNLFYFIFFSLFVPPCAAYVAAWRGNQAKGGRWGGHQGGRGPWRVEGVMNETRTRNAKLGLLSST